MSQADLERQLQALRQTLEETRQNLLSNPALAPDVVDAMLAPLRQQVAALEAQVEVARSSSGATYHVHIDSASGLASGDGAQVEMEPRGGQPALDEDTALARYLHHVVESNRRLRLQGIRSAGQLVSIDLEEVYVTLTATQRRTAAAEEAWVNHMAGLAPGEADRLARLGMDHARETVAQVRVKVQEALAAHPRLVVLGDPGCGKTTLLRYLALTYARDLAGDVELVSRRLGLAEQRLPILLPLRDFARYLEENHPDPSTDGPKLLLDYLRTYFAHQDIPLPERFFANRLGCGECAVLLDGVDEVADFATRHRVARIVERFTITYPDNRYVVASRVVGYTGSARLGEGYAVTKVRAFTLDDVRRFAAYWNRAVEVALAGGETSHAQTKARRQTEALLKAIQDNKGVQELAVNPLLLTVIALVQRYRAQLPERRTELYEEAIEVLLGKWDEAKGLETRAVMAGREFDAGDRRSLLEPIALWMMEQRAREIEAVELRQQLGQQFFEMAGERQQASKAADEFLQLIDERSGLLAERGQGVYAFSHLTFQEHLAARAVADRTDYVRYTLARLSDSWWREVILLEAGYLSTQGKRRVTALIQAVMNHKDEPEPYHNLVLAAECLRDVGPARVEGDLWGEVQGRLRAEFERPLRQSAVMKRVWKVLGRRPTQSDAVRRRAVAAEALARIESGRSGTQPAFWRQPYGEPVWVDVPAGEFWMGSEMFDHEKPVHRLYLERFQIARVPVTNVQYQFFVDATGHIPPRHWEDGRPPRGLESHPVAYVSWHDALAYCRWLAEMTGKPVTLPSEAQWEKAARGDKDRREYPWGDEWDETRCNAWELDPGGTTPVGIFPEGASPYRCLDMVGNVWEWTRSLWGQDVSEPEFRYPYDPADGRESLEASDDMLRVLRDGSFYGNRYFARCAFRSYDLPLNDWYNNGFRVVVSPISHASAL
jgi:formylglycine-generating enzyme required for sulfatase activity/energy-coupling factor transporter ATP-binding protein EcfA2